MAKIGIVVPVLNNFHGFTELVESVKSKDHELLWYVQPQHRAQIPLAAAWNKGFRDAVADGCKYVAILNDDIMLSPECLDRMAQSFFFLPKNTVLVSANNILGQLATPHEIMIYKDEDHYPLQYHDKNMNWSEHPNYSCFMVKADFFDKVGSFDENFNPAWYEDNDSHRRINLLGFKAVCTTYASCIHYGSITSSFLPPDRRDSSISRAYYIRKWGGIPESHPTQEIKEHFEHPYNDQKINAKEWIPNYAY